MPRILIVEDNLAYADEVAGYLSGNGHAVSVAGDAAGLWKILASAGFDIVLLDLGLPDEDGFTVIHQLRLMHPAIGLVVLTARVRTDSRIDGLRLGADYYLTKPTKLAEIEAVINTLSRRLFHAPPSAVTEPKWVLNAARRQLESGGGGKTDLTEKEFAFLHLLSRTPHSLPRDKVLAALNEKDEGDAGRKLDMLVYRLRKKTASSLGQELPLRTNYGGGYSLAIPFAVR